jgi:signal transduction histidine kinase
MSREGYNSALVLYDEDGREIDRFVVGMTTYEQTELLRRLFDVDEEVLNVVERRVSGGGVKYYGMWGSVRDGSDKPVGYASVVLAASERALFRGEAPEPLRPFKSDGFVRAHQALFISEYQDGKLVTSTDPERQLNAPLPPHVAEGLARAGVHDVRIDEVVGFRTFETLFVRDGNREGRVLALSIEEVGLRWHVFNLVKVALLYAVLLALASMSFVAFQWPRHKAAITGFRVRLLLAFLVISLVPLILFGYYNREFARERQEVAMSNRLQEDLALVEQRIVTSLAGEEDVDRGITDDFCEAVASEHGIDFTVYDRREVRASSRSELYASGLVDARLPGEVFARILVGGMGYTQTVESVGGTSYAVGFRPLVLDDRTFGIIAVPALFRQAELEAEVAERNAFTLAVYGVLMVLTGIAGIFLASRLSRPVRDLTNAAHRVGEGDLDVTVQRPGSGEIGDLVVTFNEMVAELKKSREELRQGERERAWKEMAKQVAHEIKNPLTPMKLLVQHLRTAFKDKAKDLDTLVEEITQTLSGQIDTLARIASEFSRFARMPERRFERVDVHLLLRETVALFAEVDGIEIQTRFSDIHLS